MTIILWLRTHHSNEYLPAHLGHPAVVDSEAGGSTRGRRGRGRTSAHTRGESRSARTWHTGGIMYDQTLHFPPPFTLSGPSRTKFCFLKPKKGPKKYLIGPKKRQWIDLTSSLNWKCHVKIEKFIHFVGVCILPITDNQLTLCRRQTSEPDECDTLPMRTYPFMGGFNLKIISRKLDLFQFFH